MKLKLGIVLFLFVLIFSACDKENDDFIENDKSDSFVSNTQEGLIVLGAKLENPYSLTNMQKALDNLIEKGDLKSSDISDIRATHYYLRFLPANMYELEQLWDDTALELFDYPLDYEIEKEGYYYQDPDIPFGKPTWLYTVVPVDYVIPNIEYEILEECFIPKEKNDGLKSMGVDESYLKIQYESYRITGNLSSDEILKSTSNILSNSWPGPKGKIEVYNTETRKFTGVRGVKVRVRSLVNISSTYTDTGGGYFISNTYSANKIRYDIIFDNRNGFKIWGNYAFLNPAVYYFGRESSSGYDAKIEQSSNAWLWSTVNNAADLYEWNLCWANGVDNPPSGMRFWTLRDNSANWGGSAPMARKMSMNLSTFKDFLLSIGVVRSTHYISLVLPDIFIAKDYTSTRATYRTVFHEMAHASHFSKVGNAYWIQYINGIVMNGNPDMYGDGTSPLDGYIGVGEMWGNYFGYICEKQVLGSASLGGTQYWFKPGIMESLDSDFGFTPQQIFSCLSSDVNNHEKLHNKIIEKYGKENDVKEAFEDFGFVY